MFAGMGDDSLYGDAGNDMLNSDAGNDQLLGGVGDDELNGGEGDDILTGNEGSDRFTLLAEGTDTITDFTLDEDLLELPEHIIFESLVISQGQEDNANNTLVNFESETIAILNNINSTEISQSDFVV